MFPPRIGFSIKDSQLGGVNSTGPLILERSCQAELDKEAFECSDRDVISSYAATLNKSVFVGVTF